MPTRRPFRHRLGTVPLRAAGRFPALALGAGLLGVLSGFSLAGCAAPKRVTAPPPITNPVPPEQSAPPVEKPGPSQADSELSSLSGTPPPPDVQDGSSPQTQAQLSAPDSAPTSEPGSRIQLAPLPPELEPSPRPRAGLASSLRAVGIEKPREVDEDIGATLAAVGLAQQLIGEPYRYGGRTPASGFDCSGLVQYVYGEQGLDLPRTARRQARAGRHVDRQELEPGDLVFFRIGGKLINHVGIYAGDDEFIHAPRSGKAVCRESLHNPWWRRRYAGARRVH